MSGQPEEEWTVDPVPDPYRRDPEVPARRRPRPPHARLPVLRALASRPAARLRRALSLPSARGGGPPRQLQDGRDDGDGGAAPRRAPRHERPPGRPPTGAPGRGQPALGRGPP